MANGSVEPWIIGIIIGAISLVIGATLFQFGNKIDPPNDFSSYGWIGIGVGLLIVGLSGYAKYKDSN